ncbi:hypothetical protein [Xanthomonas sp. XNM01]|uniref:hypothetical protein n=1 Tax=Xanthomonas sp. XNM01 TaxID=2769289 RepID=UPI00178151B7|nr:hypothetical protein [Xanthomonas sp. XNM01]MBD9369645.1 hypothetical protein [Xanthomonas sp. XNM01]
MTIRRVPRSACVVLVGLLAACAGGEGTAEPPRPVDDSPQPPVVADASQPVASGNTRAAADVAAIAALGAGFDPQRDARADLETAKVEARRGGKRIVLELGDAACAACETLDTYLEGNDALRRQRDAGLVWVRIDRSAEAGNADLLSAYPGVDAPAPFLLVLDAEGQVLHAQEGLPLVPDGTPDRKAIEAFVAQWAAPATPAP